MKGLSLQLRQVIYDLCSFCGRSSDEVEMITDACNQCLVAVQHLDHAGVLEHCRDCGDLQHLYTSTLLPQGPDNARCMSCAVRAGREAIAARRAATGRVHQGE
jgi:hypothetical protein